MTKLMVAYRNFANAFRKTKSLQKGRTRKQESFYDGKEEKESERRMDGRKVRRKEGRKCNAIKQVGEGSKSRERWKWRERKKV